eukprot:COSAG03_NODE_390_length_8302_cov_70.582317_4_plen_394_part_00
MPTILYVYAKTSNVSIELQEEFKQLYALVVRNNRKLATQTGFDQNGTNPPAALPAHAAEQGRGDMGWTNPAPGGLAGQMQSRPGGQPLSANPGMAPAASAAASSAAPVSMPAPTPVAATGNRQAAAGQASNATTQAAAGPSDGTFAADIEEEANSYFQKIYTSQQSIKGIISMLQGFKNSTNPREQDIFKCMIHNLFDEYRFFPKYPDKELKITGILFGSLIQHGLVSSITLGIALRYVLEALKKPVGSKMFKFGFCALEQFKSRVHEWPTSCSHILQIPHLRQSNPETVAYIEASLQAAQSHFTATSIAPTHTRTCVPCRTGTSAPMGQGQQQQLHSHITDTTATVAVGGLSSPLTVRHLSDSHISLDSDLEPHSRRMHDAFFGTCCCVLSC